jgi:hypothetical protein
MRNGKYELVVAPHDYPGMRYRGRYCYEHILVWWQNAGKIPPKGYEIHHINMDHRDNRFSNLQLVSSSDHRKLHGAMISKKSRESLPKIHCHLCKGEFSLKGSIYRARLKKNKSGKLYCTTDCQHKSMQGGRKDRRLAVN